MSDLVDAALLRGSPTASGTRMRAGRFEDVIDQVVAETATAELTPYSLQVLATQSAWTVTPRLRGSS